MAILVLKYLIWISSNLINLVLFKRHFIEVLVPKQKLVILLMLFKNHSIFRFKQLIDISALDRPGKKFRFSVFYQLLSLDYCARLNVRTELAEASFLPTVSYLYESASWSEREVWDMYGLYFKGHHDLRRILTDYGFSGHPLRKDFPLSGFLELYYDDWCKRVVYEPIELAQEYRSFSFKLDRTKY